MGNAHSTIAVYHLDSGVLGSLLPPVRPTFTDSDDSAEPTVRTQTASTDSRPHAGRAHNGALMGEGSGPAHPVILGLRDGSDAHGI